MSLWPTVFHTEPTLGWKHKTPNLVEATERVQGASGSWGVFIPTCQTSSYSGNCILPPESVPAAAVRCSPHLHLTEWSPEAGLSEGSLLTPRQLHSWNGCLPALAELGFAQMFAKGFGLKHLYTCKVLLSPNLFLSSTLAPVMRNQSRMPHSFHSVQAWRPGFCKFIWPAQMLQNWTANLLKQLKRMEGFLLQCLPVTSATDKKSRPSSIARVNSIHSHNAAKLSSCSQGLGVGCEGSTLGAWELGQ